MHVIGESSRKEHGTPLSKETSIEGRTGGLSLGFVGASGAAFRIDERKVKRGSWQKKKYSLAVPGELTPLPSSVPPGRKVTAEKWAGGRRCDKPRKQAIAGEREWWTSRSPRLAKVCSDNGMKEGQEKIRLEGGVLRGSDQCST